MENKVKCSISSLATNTNTGPHIRGPAADRINPLSSLADDIVVVEWCHRRLSEKLGGSRSEHVRAHTHTPWRVNKLHSRNHAPTFDFCHLFGSLSPRFATDDSIRTKVLLKFN